MELQALQSLGREQDITPKQHNELLCKRHVHPKCKACVRQTSSWLVGQQTVFQGTCRQTVSSAQHSELQKYSSSYEAVWHDVTYASP